MLNESPRINPAKLFLTSTELAALEPSGVTLAVSLAEDVA
jgi:hypothetical protein